MSATAGQAQSQSVGEVAPIPAASVARAVRAVPEAPVLDGKLDDAAWSPAPVLDGFRQREPNEGQPGTERTEARVVYTDQALYVAVRAHDRQASRIAAQLTRRDEDSPSDWIGVVIDSYYDRRTAFQFAVNPAGVKRDIYHYDDTNEDTGWDAVWDVAVARDDQGWTAEFRIPFSQLRFADRANHVFGFDLYRKIARLNENQQWKLIPKNASGLVSQMGELAGVSEIRPPRRLEVLPYSVASANRRPPVAGNPFRTGTRERGTAGADVKFGVTSNLTLSATVNPDFGQVEADPAQVNLSAFESYFSERRPFFSEGMDIFQFPGGNLFYSRRVGRPPQGSANERGGHAEEVGESTILFASKLSGKTPSGWTIGALGALTDQESAAVIDSVGGRHVDIIEPRTVYLVGRLAREYRKGQTRVGAFGTAVHRDLAPSLQFLRRDAYVGGLDFNHRFRNDTYWFSGWMTASTIRGSTDAISRAQRSSARYYQRPDNDYREFDSTRTSLSGVAANLGVGKSGGGVWRFSTGIDTRSPGYEINDAGFQGSVDWHGQWFWLNRRWQQPGKVFRNLNLNLNQWSTWSYGWDRISLGTNVNANGQFLNYWGFWGGMGVNFPEMTPNALRGGPIFIRPRGMNTWGGFHTDNRKPVSFEFDGWAFVQAARDTRSFGMDVSVRWRPSSNISFSFGPGVDRIGDDWQYLKTETVFGREEYFFGDLRQTTVSAEFRGNITLSPTLSVQLYAQPFVSTGNYVEFKRVADPRGATYDDRFDNFGSDRLIRAGSDVSVDLDRDGTPDVELGNPNFDVRSFRSNAVVRWEYRPGSTIFLVWQHGRSASDSEGRFNFGDDFGAMFRGSAENTVMLKVNYWLSL